jgi:GTP-binding protein
LNYFRINNIFYFVDLPGYGYARVPAAERKSWQVLIENYITGNRLLCGVISIIDIRIGPTKLDSQLMQWLDQNSIKSIVVATKADKLSRSAINRQITKYNTELNSNVLPFSARNGNGKKQVWREIETLME